MNHRSIVASLNAKENRLEDDVLYYTMLYLTKKIDMSGEIIYCKNIPYIIIHDKLCRLEPYMERLRNVMPISVEIIMNDDLSYYFEFRWYIKIDNRLASFISK